MRLDGTFYLDLGAFSANKHGRLWGHRLTPGQLNKVQHKKGGHP